MMNDDDNNSNINCCLEGRINYKDFEISIILIESSLCKKWE
jgi:hypothetical protein